MKAASAKAKGRNLQKLVRDYILKKFPKLHEDDVRSTAMGQGGEDVQLSPAARKLFPFSIECKSIARVSIYKYMEQCIANCPKGCYKMVVIKGNHKKPLVVMEIDEFFKCTTNWKSSKNQ